MLGDVIFFIHVCKLVFISLINKTVLLNLTLSLAIFDQHGNFYCLLISSLGKNGVTLLSINTAVTIILFVTW